MRTSRILFPIAIALLAGMAIGLSGCGQPAAEQEPTPISERALDPAMDSSTVRWARGFGFEAQGTILWLAHDGDTTRWVQGPVPAPPVHLVVVCLLSFVACTDLAVGYPSHFAV